MNKEEKEVWLKETYDYLKNTDFDKVECQSDIYLDYIMLYEENKQLKEMFEDTKTYTKEHLYKYNKDLLEANKKLQQENKQLKDNWNKLKEYIKENSFDFEDGSGYVIHDAKIVYCDDILEKMQELETGDSND